MVSCHDRHQPRRVSFCDCRVPPLQLQHVIAERCVIITELVLDQLGANIAPIHRDPEILADTVCKALECCKHLNRLSLRWIAFGTGVFSMGSRQVLMRVSGSGFRRVCSAIAEHDCLKTLDMWRNTLYVEVGRCSLRTVELTLVGCKLHDSDA